jgi:hypothetical protein
MGFSQAIKGIFVDFWQKPKITYRLRDTIFSDGIIDLIDSYLIAL